MNWNAPFLIVHDAGKAGIYCNPSGETKMTVPCSHEELIRFKYNDMFYCAARRGTKWAILDWLTGNLLTDYKYKNFADISVPRGVKPEAYK